MRVWDPVLIGHSRSPTCDKVLHRSKLTERKGILSMAKFASNSPPVTCSPIHMHNVIIMINKLMHYRKATNQHDTCILFNNRMQIDLYFRASLELSCITEYSTELS